MQGAGQANDPGKQMGIPQSVGDGSITAHGQAANEGVFPVMRESEHVPGHINQFFDERRIVFAVCLVVSVKPVVAAWHDDSQAVVRGPAQNPGPCDPVGIVAENAMEQVEGFERCVFFPLPVKSCLVTGKDGVKRNRTHESLRKEVHFGQCHGSVLLYVQKNCLWRMQECQTQPRWSDGFPKQHVPCQPPAGIGVQKFLASSFLVW